MDFKPQSVTSAHVTLAINEAASVLPQVIAAFPVARIAGLTLKESAYLFVNLQYMILARAHVGDHYEPYDWPDHPEVKYDYGHIDETFFPDEVSRLDAANRRLFYSAEFEAWLGGQMRDFWTDCKTSDAFRHVYSDYFSATLGERHQFTANLVEDFFFRLHKVTGAHFLPPMLDYAEFTGLTAGTFDSAGNKITISADYRSEYAFCNLLDTLTHEMSHSVMDQLRRVGQASERFPFAADIELSSLKNECCVYADSSIRSVYTGDSEETICRAQSDILTETMRPNFGFRTKADYDAERQMEEKSDAIKEMLRSMPWEKKWREERRDWEKRYKQTLAVPLAFLPADRR